MYFFDTGECRIVNIYSTEMVFGEQDDREGFCGPWWEVCPEGSGKGAYSDISEVLS